MAEELEKLKVGKGTLEVKETVSLDEKRSEAWISGFTILCATVLAGFEIIPGEWWLGLVASVTGLYQGNRTWLKGVKIDLLKTLSLLGSEVKDEKV